MNKAIGTALLVFGAINLGACASAPHQSAANEPKLAQATPGTSGAKHSGCLRETGSRLKAKEGECLAGPGIVITREELERSGAIRTIDQLKRLPGM